MREIEARKITETIKELCLEANFDLRDDVLEALKKALKVEESPLGREVLEILIENAEIASGGRRPLCQDTGLVTVFLEMGQEVMVTGGDLITAINEGVRRGYQQGYLRKSVVNEPLFIRKNTLDNTPALIYPKVVKGEKLKITVMPKGAGCDNASALKMIVPSEGVEGVKKFVLETVREANGHPCPPMVVGLGVGGSFDKAPILAKKALLRRVGEPNKDPKLAHLEEEILAEINKLGIGPMGWGGKVTALGVMIETFPSHLASLPVAVDISCHSLRSATIEL